MKTVLTAESNAPKLMTSASKMAGELSGARKS